MCGFQQIHALVCASGTGGTIAGLSNYLKDQDANIKVFLIDPPGSFLAGYVRTGTLKHATPGTVSVLEGVGSGRITANFARARIDDAFHGDEREAVEMAHWLARNEGIFVGPSAAMNVAGAVKAARLLGPGHTIVTILCDGGERNRSKLYNAEYLEAHGLTPIGSTSKTLDFIKFNS